MTGFITWAGQYVGQGRHQAKVEWRVGAVEWRMGVRRGLRPTGVGMGREIMAGNSS